LSYLSFNPTLVTGKTKPTKNVNEIPSFHLQVLLLLCDSPAAAVPCSVVGRFLLPLPTGVMKEEEEYDSVVKWFKPDDANLGSFRFLQPTQYCKFGKFKDCGKKPE